MTETQPIYKDCLFPGYANICHDFNMLLPIFKSQKDDWKAALENIKGVYVVTDKSNGKKYVGSAYGEAGIWARWSCYIGTGHGYNNELTRIISHEGIEYAMNNFKLALLEYCSMKTDDRIIIQRESYWKDIFQSRGKFGYNKN
ncbi:MAG: GIY-YIG nuclease family protein [Lentisphaerota bacterium]